MALSAAIVLARPLSNLSERGVDIAVIMSNLCCVMVLRIIDFRNQQDITPA